MTRVIPYLLYLWLIAMHQVFLGDVTSIWVVRINLPILFVVVIAMFKGELTVAWFAVADAAVAFAGIPRIMGWEALGMTMIGGLAYNIKERLNLESMYAKLLLVYGGVWFHNVYTSLLLGIRPTQSILWLDAFLGAAYTSLLAWVFFLIREERLTVKKFKALF